MFDLIDESSNENDLTSAEASTLTNPYYSEMPVPELSDNQLGNSASRDKFGNLNEAYGSIRFGALFLDNLFSATNLNKCKCTLLSID